MENSTAKKPNKITALFKKVPKWALTLAVVVILVLAVVLTVVITKQVNMDPGERVFNAYLTATKKNNASDYAELFYEKGSDEYEEFKQIYQEGLNEYKSFKSSATADDLLDYESKSINYTENPMDYGLKLYTEGLLSKNIKSYSITSIRSEKYYSELKLSFTLKESTLKLPQKFNKDPAISTTVRFKKVGGKWYFEGVFTLIEAVQDVAQTWAAPYGDGYELKFVNTNDMTGVVSIKDIEEKLGLDKPIVKIGDYAFMVNGASNYSLRNLRLTENVKEIGKYAFKNCVSLETIRILDESGSVSNVNAESGIVINEGSFYNCLKLKDFEICTANTVVPAYAFYRCQELSSVTLAANITSVGHYAFYGIAPVRENGESDEDLAARSIREIIISDKVMSIGDSAFEGMTQLTKITEAVSANGTANLLSGNLKRLGANAFKNTGITSIAFPNTFKELPKGVLSGASSLVSLEFSEDLHTISSYALSGTAITSISIKNVAVIGEGAFEGCDKLLTVDFGTSPKIRNIAAKAFKGATSLYEIEIPSSVEGIGDQAFVDCDNLRVVMLNCDAGITVGEMAFVSLDNIPKFYVPYEYGIVSRDLEGKAVWDDVILYSFRTANWNRLDLEIYSNTIINEESKMAIVERQSTNADGKLVNEKVLIQYLGTAESVTLSNSLGITHIGDGAFSHNLSLRKFSFDSNSIKGIGENVFSGCKKLEYDVYVSGVEGTLKFLGDWLIETVYNGKTLDLTSQNSTLLRKQVYAVGSDGYRTVDANGNFIFVEQDVKSPLPKIIGTASSAFRSSSIESAVLPASLMYIGDNTFRQNASLTTVNFAQGSQLESIGSYAFMGCAELLSINTSRNLVSIGDYAFNLCTSLRYMQLQSNVVKLGNNVFSIDTDVFKLYVNNTEQDSFYANNDAWRAYSSMIYNASIIDGNYAIDGEVLVQYLGIDGDIDTADIDVTQIGRGAFAFSKVTGIAIASKITRIEAKAFFSCGDIASIRFDDDGSGENELVYIGNYAFVEVTGLSEYDRKVDMSAITKVNDTFSMGVEVFEEIERVVTVPTRDAYISNESWAKYSNRLDAIDDPRVKVEVLVDGVVANSGDNKVNSTLGFSYQYAPGSEIYLWATKSQTHEFIGWFIDGTKVEGNATYSFTIQKGENIVIEARFEVI